MSENDTSPIRVTCPCCGSILNIDTSLATVLSHQEPARPQPVAHLKDANRHLKEEANRRDEKVQNIRDAEKNKGEVLEKKFQELLKKAKEEPLKKPLKDIDLD